VECCLDVYPVAQFSRQGFTSPGCFANQWRWEADPICCSTKHGLRNLSLHRAAPCANPNPRAASDLTALPTFLLERLERWEAPNLAAVSLEEVFFLTRRGETGRHPLGPLPGVG